MSLGIFFTHLGGAGLLLGKSLGAAKLQGAGFLSDCLQGALLQGPPVDGREDWVFIEGRGRPKGYLLQQLWDLTGGSLIRRFGGAGSWFLAARQLTGNGRRQRRWCAAGAPLHAQALVQSWPSAPLGGLGPRDVHAQRVRLPKEAVGRCATTRAAFRGAYIHRGFGGHGFSTPLRKQEEEEAMG